MGAVVAAVSAFAASSTIAGVLVQFALGQAISFVVGKIFGSKQEAGSFVQAKSDLKRTFRSSAASRRIIYGQTMVSGPIVYVASTGAEHKYLHLIVALAGHEVDSIGDVYVGDRLSTHSKIAGLVRVNKHLGATNQAADTNLVQEVPQWTSSHTLSGIAYVYVRLTWDQDVWINGIPNIKALVKGKKVFDPRNSTTAWSNNWALCIRDYLTSADGLSADVTEIDDTQLIAAANICDEQVTLTTGTQSRYTCDGVVLLDKKPAEILDSLLTGGAGSVVYTQGLYSVHPGAYTTPTVTLDESDLRDAIKVRPRFARRELFNAVRGVYVSPDNKWEPSDFPPVTNAVYEAQDDNQQIFRDIELSYTTDGIRAQRIAKIHLEKSRQGITVDFPAKLTALQIAAMDVVMLSISSMGWTNKPFRVMAWTLSADGGVDLTLQEEAANSYDWNFGEATIVDPAPDSDLADPSSIDAPSNILLSSGTNELIIGGNGTILSRIRIDWTPPQAVTVSSIEIQYKLTSDSVWSGSKVINGDAVTAWITGVIDGQLYDVRLRSVSILGVRSPWTYTSHFVTGKSALPADVQNFTVTRQPDGTREFVWDEVTEPDLAGYKIRYALGFGATWTTMTDLQKGLLQSSPWETNQLAAGDYTLAIKAVDTTGNESVNAVFINSSLGDPRIANSFATENPHRTGWQGILTNCAVDKDGLIAQGNYNWDSLTTWDNWTSWANNWFTSITYEHTLIDLGGVVVFKPLLTADTTGTQTIEINVSNDNVTWGGWKVPAGLETARYFKARVTVVNAAAPPQVGSFSIILSGDSIEEIISDSNTSAWGGSAGAGREIPIQKSFAVITSIQVALQSVGAGWSWEVLSKNNTTPVIRIYNNGSAADALVDVAIKGIKT